MLKARVGRQMGYRDLIEEWRSGCGEAFARHLQQIEEDMVPTVLLSKDIEIVRTKEQSDDLVGIGETSSCKAAMALGRLRAANLN